jgi:DNA primase
LLEQAPLYLDYLIERARKMDLSSGEGKLRALNFLMPYVQRVPNRLLRSEWATRISAELRIEEPVLREALRKAAAERRYEVKPKAELLASGAKLAERRLIRMLAEADTLRVPIATAIVQESLHSGLETERIFAALLAASVADSPPDITAIAQSLPDKDSRLLYDIVFNTAIKNTWEDAESCLAVLRSRKRIAEIKDRNREISEKSSRDEQRPLMIYKHQLRKQELHSSEPSMQDHDRVLKCVDCGAEFVFSVNEQKFRADKGFAKDPRRCKNCDPIGHAGF